MGKKVETCIKTEEIFVILKMESRSASEAGTAFSF
jgi:hypothetical protein